MIFFTFDSEDYLLVNTFFSFNFYIICNFSVYSRFISDARRELKLIFFTFDTEDYLLVNNFIQLLISEVIAQILGKVGVNTKLVSLDLL